MLSKIICSFGLSIDLFKKYFSLKYRLNSLRPLCHQGSPTCRASDSAGLKSNLRICIAKECWVMPMLVVYKCTCHPPALTPTSVYTPCPSSDQASPGPCHIPLQIRLQIPHLQPAVYHTGLSSHWNLQSSQKIKQFSPSFKINYLEFSQYYLQPNTRKKALRLFIVK